MPERIQRFLIWFLAVALIVGTVVALRFAGGYRQVAGLSAPPPLPADVTFRLNHVRGIGRQNNRLAWSLSADRVDTTRERTKVDFVGNIALNLFTAETNRGNLTATERGRLTANTASYLAPNKLLLIGGKVIAILRDPKKGNTARDSLRLETEQVQWNVGTRQISCPRAVSLTMKDSQVIGDQLTVDLATRDFSMRHVHGHSALDEGAAPPDPFGDILPRHP